MASNIQAKLPYLNQVLKTNDNVLGEIYIITNKITNKRYIGQTVSHKLNCGLYKPFGCQKRLNQHTSDAINNTKKKQCSYLNNSIRKYGKDNFVVELLEYCLPAEANDREIFYIKELNSMFPNGYNLTEGGKKGPTLQVQKEKLMHKSKEQFKESKFLRFSNVKVDLQKIESYIWQGNHARYGGTYYIVAIGGVRSIFVGKYLSKDILKQQAIDFVHELSRRSATHLNCEEVLRDPSNTSV
jgi:group I intron endonuclease